MTVAGISTAKTGAEGAGGIGLGSDSTSDSKPAWVEQTTASTVKLNQRETPAPAESGVAIAGAWSVGERQIKLASAASSGRVSTASG